MACDCKALRSIKSPGICTPLEALWVCGFLHRLGPFACAVQMPVAGKSSQVIQYPHLIARYATRQSLSASSCHAGRPSPSNGFGVWQWEEKVFGL